MRERRGWIVVVLMAVLAAACTGGEPSETSSTQPPTSTTVQQTSTTTDMTGTTAPPTTQVPEDDPWTTEYPLDPATVDDLPAVLTWRIDAAEPIPNLEVAGAEHTERWVNEWLSWFAWVNANPTDGAAALDHAVVPQSAFYEDSLVALEARQQDGTRLLGFAFVPVEVSGTFDEFFESREALRLVVIASDTIPRYVIDDTGTVVSVHEPGGGQTTLRLLLRYSEGMEGWILEGLEVVG